MFILRTVDNFFTHKDVTSLGYSKTTNLDLCTSLRIVVAKTWNGKYYMQQCVEAKGLLNALGKLRTRKNPKRMRSRPHNPPFQLILRLFCFDTIVRIDPIFLLSFEALPYHGQGRFSFNSELPYKAMSSLTRGDHVFPATGFFPQW